MGDKDDKILHIIEIARNTGKVRIGTNEATKATERGIAKLIVTAENVDPKEVIMHLAPLCKEKNIPIASVADKNELGRSAGIDVPTAAIAILDAGEAKKDIDALGGKPAEEPKKEAKPEKKEEPKEEKPAEKPKEEAKPEKKEESKEKKEDK